jgi:hemerythrin superfamily protein
MDAIAMLKQQHREVDSLFESIRTASEDEKILLLGKLSEQLTIHAQLEERHVYPFAQRVGIQDMVDHALEEHAKVKQLIAEILSLKRHDPRVDENIQMLQQSVQAHVAEEESAFFPRLASLTQPDDLMNLGMEMQRTMEELSQQELLAMAESQGAMSP